MIHEFLPIARTVKVLSEFIGTVVNQDAVTLLDINNSVPADTKLRAYVAQGEILPVATRSFGFIGVFAILEMGRFYRYVLIEKNFPHHGAVAFGHFGKILYEVFKYIFLGKTACGQHAVFSVSKKQGKFLKKQVKILLNIMIACTEQHKSCG